MNILIEERTIRYYLRRGDLSGFQSMQEEGPVSRGNFRRARQGKKGQCGDKKRTVLENNSRIPGINFILNIHEFILGKDAEVFPGLDSSPFFLPSLAN